MFLPEGEPELIERVTLLVFQLAVILVLAKLGGEVTNRYLKLPAVVGEILVGVAIGPYALGHLIDLGGIIPGSDLGELFEKPASPTKAISPELFSVSQVAAIVLLFVVGLETNLAKFMRYARPGFVVAMGGVIAPFFLGAYATVLFDYADNIDSAQAMFMGAAMTATSVAVTARVLSENRKLDTPEGVTILAAAVIDDVLGILALTVAVGVADTGKVSPRDLAEVGGKALAFLAIWFGGGLLAGKYLARFVMSLKVTGAGIAIMLGLALLASGLAESFGLAFIIGAYATGLVLSPTNLARKLEEPLSGVYHALAPVFFVVQGMQVDVTAFGDTIGLGVVICLLAIASKVFGAGLPALGLGFNTLGSARIGFGMLPRAEVALIIAGIGLTRGVIGLELFGVVVLMAIVTTVIAPIALMPLFAREVSGTRGQG